MAGGRFITFEGGEGAGKSTQVRLLATRLRSDGLQVVATREPGGAPGAERIRSLLVDGAVDQWDPVSETLLHFAARREHLARLVWPALARGDWVVSDRFADSTMAYQGYGGGVSRAVIDVLYAQAVGDFRPDLTLILDMPVEAGLARAIGRGEGASRYERMGMDFHHRLREGFLDIARREPQRCVVIDATRSVEDVADDVIANVRERLGRPVK